jgi:hypothetical protein
MAVHFPAVTTPAAGDHVPRAKRTNRAEARRRYRASIGEPIEEEEEFDDDAEPQAAARSPAPKTPGATQERPSLMHAFRAAFRPPNVREDLRALPRLIIDRSVWLPSLLTVAAGIAFAITGGGNWLIALVATYFVAPPALGSVFLGGFLAPRASYLVGLIIGFVSAVVASVVILTSSASLVTGQPLVATPSPTPVSSPAASVAASASPAAASAAPAASGSPAPSGSAAASPTPSASPSPPPQSVQDQVIYAFLTSPIFGMFFAASAAWYRRFLRLSNPNRGRPQQQKRGPDGRSRSNPNQRR